MALPVIETEILLLLILAIIVAIIARRTRFPYTIALVFVGLFVTFTKIELVPLSKEVIFFLFLPPLLFEGAVHIHISDIWENKKTISLLAIVGVLISVFFIGFSLKWLLRIPLLFGLLFGAIISPTDPVSVLAIFKKLKVSKKLSTIIEGESLFNDGTGVVIYEIIVGLILSGHFSVSEVILKFLKVVAGGIIVGGLAGLVVYHLMRRIDDHLIEVMSTIVLAYGSFVLAESLHVSGVISVVVAGLLIGNYGKRLAMSPKTRIAVVGFWELIVFFVNSLIFIFIGATIPVESFTQHFGYILIAIVLVLLARAISVYSITNLTDFFREKTPKNWQHIINWAGLRGSIPIALVLGIQTLNISYKEEITYMAFGVVFFSLAVQGLTAGQLVNKLRLGNITDEEKEVEFVLARKAAVKRALRELEKAYNDGEFGELIYHKLKKEYEKKLENYKKEYEKHIRKKGVVKLKKEKFARRKALLAEKSAVLDQIMKGLISEDLGREIIAEIDELLDETE